jgi:hypothetical protein
VSPQDMAAASRCARTCRACARARTVAKRFRIIGWLLVVLALAAIGAGIPVDGLPGVALAVAGIALAWTGRHLVVRRGRRAAR